MSLESCIRPHVVVVDDERDLCELLALRLEHHGYRVTTKHSGRDALRLLEVDQADAMLLDLRLEQENGLDVLAEAQRRILDVPVLVLTAHATIELAVEAMRIGAHGVLTKPFDDGELLGSIGDAVEQVRIRREAAALPNLSESERLIGTSQRMEAVRATVARVAPSAATVLLLGESGTGKEVAARTLHTLSRRTGRFVAVNCGALPAELLESELFGHVRGAFTGAARDKQGLFAAANGGTLFLDEVGDAPPSVQVKLLRVLQERCYVPVGATEPEQADVRVIAATNRDLRTDVAAGRFREDLFYRLHVLPISLPPLRERREDLPLLAELFLSRAAARHGLSVTGFSADALDLLTNHGWPGNVRELANVIEGAALLCTERLVSRQHVLAVLALPPWADPTVASGHEARPSALASTGPEPGMMLAPLQREDGSLPPLREARVAFDRAYLIHVLSQAAGNVTTAARIAGRNRTDFYDLLHRYSLYPLHYRP